MKVKFISDIIPNLPFMKLSAYHKEKGDNVSFDYTSPDLVYGSCIFSWNKETILQQIKKYRCQTVIGGYGINTTTLPENIEHTMPDYSLYGLDYSLGFTSRGCIRNCPWCIVPNKEGQITNNAPLSEFLYPNHKKIMLFDNNFQASPRWKENLKEIIDKNLEVCFNQGLDFRLITEEFAKFLSECKYRDKKFKNKRLYFSFDHPSIEKDVIKGVQTLTNAGIKPKEIMVYMLIGFDENLSKPNRFVSELEDVFHRFNVLTSLGVRPYPMLYNRRQDKPLLSKFQRWVIGRYYEVFPFEEYDTSKINRKQIDESKLIPLDDYFGQEK